jgi:tRNA pseudouridine38-40 synthase
MTRPVTRVSNDDSADGLRRLALLVEYDGTEYRGSQYQANAPTVQGSLERALSSLTDEPIRVALAGRTDAGVHARGQVASFSTASSHTVDTFLRGTNALLPRDISLRSAAEVSFRFDPRRHALSRWYRYTIRLGGQRPALAHRVVAHVTSSLDLGMMAEAAECLAGRHDFAAFTQTREAKRTCTERVVAVAQMQSAEGTAFFDIEANAFLPHMVRRIVGALIEVGTGRRDVKWFGALLDEAPPGGASRMAAAQGLCLMKVRYESGLFDDETNEDI